MQQDDNAPLLGINNDIESQQGSSSNLHVKEKKDKSCCSTKKMAQLLNKNSADKRSFAVRVIEDTALLVTSETMRTGIQSMIGDVEAPNMLGDVVATSSDYVLAQIQQGALALRDWAAGNPTNVSARTLVSKGIGCIFASATGAVINVGKVGGFKFSDNHHEQRRIEASFGYGAGLSGEWAANKLMDCLPTLRK